MVTAFGRTGGCAIAVMAKSPVPGRVKTRLVPPLSEAGACALSRAFLTDVTHNIAAAARHAPIHGYVAYAPAGSEAAFDGILAPGTGLVAADGTAISVPGVIGFGRALLDAARSLFALGHEAVCLLNADSPTLPTTFLAQAATALIDGEGDRVVLGPAEDGGYYLIGLRAPHPQLFSEIAWSTAVVAEQTRERARTLSLPIVELAPWYDVDDATALARLSYELSTAAAAHPATPYAADATIACLRQQGLQAMADRPAGVAV